MYGRFFNDQCDADDQRDTNLLFLMESERTSQQPMSDFENERLKAEADEREAAVEAFLANQRANADRMNRLAEEREREAENEWQRGLASVEALLANKQRMESFAAERERAEEAERERAFKKYW